MAGYEGNGYVLSRLWFDFCFENVALVNPNHSAMFMWFVELNNRLGWVEKFASPASQTMAAIGMKSYNTYKKTFDDLVNWGFVKLVKASKNQWTASIIALSKNDKARNKALDKALTMHLTKQSESTCKSTDSIIKPINKETNKPINNTVGEKRFSPPTHDQLISYFTEKKLEHWDENRCVSEAVRFYDFYDSKNWMVGKNKMSKWKAAVSGWINRSVENKGKTGGKNGKHAKSGLGPGGIEPQGNIDSYGKL